MATLRRPLRQFLRYAGTVSGNEAFTGPHRAEIYLTNKCNLDCIACWTFSPLLKGTNGLAPVEIEWPKAQALIEDLAREGCEEILFVGGGEPMIYPKIMEALELVKSLGMSCFVTTNMTPVTGKRAQRMVEIGVDRLYVSLWAATPHTYDITHPNAGEKEWRHIDKILREFRDLKARTGKPGPKIVIHNVIFNLNYHEVRAMVDYALETGVDAVQFTVAYTLPDRTDALLMDKAMREEVLKQLDSIPQETHTKEGIHGPGTFLWEVDIFRSRVEEKTASEGNYDGSLLDNLPCQIGWFFTAIRANGDVIPCCKGQERPMGNIYKNSFNEIWYDHLYNEFRDKAKHLPKSDPYFEIIGCTKMCDNIGQLRTIEGYMKKLRPIEFPTAISIPLIRRAKR